MDVFLKQNPGIVVSKFLTKVRPIALLGFALAIGPTFLNIQLATASPCGGTLSNLAAQTISTSSLERVLDDYVALTLSFENAASQSPEQILLKSLLENKSKQLEATLKQAGYSDAEKLSIIMRLNEKLELARDLESGKIQTLTNDEKDARDQEAEIFATRYVNDERFIQNKDIQRYFFSPNSKYLCLTGERYGHVISLQNHALVTTFPGDIAQMAPNSTHIRVVKDGATDVEDISGSTQHGYAMALSSLDSPQLSQFAGGRFLAATPDRKAIGEVSNSGTFMKPVFVKETYKLGEPIEGFKFSADKKYLFFTRRSASSSGNIGGFIAEIPAVDEDPLAIKRISNFIIKDYEFVGNNKFITFKYDNRGPSHVYENRELYELATGQRHTINISRSDVHFSPDASEYLAIRDGHLELYETKNQKLISTYETTKSVIGLQYTPDGKNIAIAFARNGGIEIISRTAFGHSGQRNFLALYPTDVGYEIDENDKPIEAEILISPDEKYLTFKYNRHFFLFKPNPLRI